MSAGRPPPGAAGGQTPPKAGAGASSYFVDAKKGEVNELRNVRNTPPDTTCPRAPRVCSSPDHISAASIGVRSARALLSAVCSL